MALNRIAVPVPDLPGPSTWVASSLVKITSFGLSKTATALDQVRLCGSNDNTVSVTSAEVLGDYADFAGSQNQQNAGARGDALGAFLFYAVIRKSGPTAGLNFNIVGSDATGATGPAGPAGPAGPTGPAGPAAGLANFVSWVDIATASVAQGGTPTRTAHGTPWSGGNIFWQTSPTATCRGGRIFWIYSGSGTDVVTVKLWGGIALATLLATATLNIAASGVITFVWDTGPVIPISAYKLFGITMTTPALGFTSVNASSLDISNAISGGIETYGAPPFTGTIMAGPNLNWYFCGLQYSGSGTPNGNGFGSSTTYSPVEPIIVP